MGGSRQYRRRNSAEEYSIYLPHLMMLLKWAQQGRFLIKEFQFFSLFLRSHIPLLSQLSKTELPTIEDFTSISSPHRDQFPFKLLSHAKECFVSVCLLVPLPSTDQTYRVYGNSIRSFLGALFENLELFTKTSNFKSFHFKLKFLS